MNPKQAVYDGIAAPRDGGYMTVVRPAPAGGAMNPLYAHSSSEANYDGVANQVSTMGIFQLTVCHRIIAGKRWKAFWSRRAYILSGKWTSSSRICESS